MGRWADRGFHCGGAAEMNIAIENGADCSDLTGPRHRMNQQESLGTTHHAGANEGGILESRFCDLICANAKRYRRLESYRTKPFRPRGPISQNDKDQETVHDAWYLCGLAGSLAVGFVDVVDPSPMPVDHDRPLWFLRFWMRLFQRAM
jgi:hypothetical protein